MYIIIYEAYVYIIYVTVIVYILLYEVLRMFTYKNIVLFVPSLLFINTLLHYFNFIKNT